MSFMNWYGRFPQGTKDKVAMNKRYAFFCIDDIPSLVKRIEELTEALEFYAEEDNYKGWCDALRDRHSYEYSSNMDRDMGEKARAALAVEQD